MSRRVRIQDLFVAPGLVLVLVGLALGGGCDGSDSGSDDSGTRSNAAGNEVLEAQRVYFDLASRWESGPPDEVRAEIPGAVDRLRAANEQWRSREGGDGEPNPSICVWIGDLQRRAGHRMEAFRYLRQAVDLRPDQADAYHATGLLLEDLEDPERAVPCFRQARDLGFDPDPGPEIGRALRRLASLKRTAGSCGQAILLLEESLREWPEGEGNTESRSELEQLREEKRLALETPPPADDDVEGRLDRAVLLGRWGAWDRAREILDALRRAAPDNPRILYLLARWGFEEAGAFEKAGELYATAARMNPESVDARLGMLRCNVFFTDKELAREPQLRLKLLEGLPDTPRVLVQRAWALRELWKVEEAQALLEKASEGQGPGVIDALRMLWEDDPGGSRGAPR